MRRALAPKLIAVTDLGRATADEHVDAYARLSARLPSGALAIQLRGSGVSARALVALVAALRARIPEVALVANDRLDLVKALELDGAHLAGASVGVADARAYLGDVWLSVAIHDPHADVAGADAALLAPIFATPGKGPPLGEAALAVFAERGGPPVYALGGVDGTNAKRCIASGAAGVAAIRACLDPRAHDALVRALLEA